VSSILVTNHDVSLSWLLLGTSYGARHWGNEMAACLRDATGVGCCSHLVTNRGNPLATKTYAMAKYCKILVDTADTAVVYGRDTNNAGGPQTSQSAPSVRLKAVGFTVAHRRALALPLISNPLFSCSLCPSFPIPTSTRHHTFLCIHFFLISRR